MLTATVLAAVAMGCQPPDEESAPMQQVADRPECPHDWDWEELSDPQRRLEVEGEVLSVPAEIQNVPEFHDCQRFLVLDPATNALRYDSLFAIFAWNNLPQLSGMLGELAEDGSPDAVAAAEIYAENDYDTLGIEDGFNCLYLWKDGNDWHAKMVAYGTNEQDCTAPVDPDQLAGESLVVQPRPQGPFTNPVHYPPVARWGWDATNQIQYVEIACFPRWCEVGPEGFEASDPRVDFSDPTASLQERRVFEIKGWYDEQRLATLSFTSGLPVPTDLVGTFIPDPALGDLSASDFPEGTWVPAARVALSGTNSAALAAYKAKFNLDPTTPGQLNEIQLCRGTQDECAVSGNVASGTCPGSVQPWWARVVAVDGSELYKCVTRRVPGSVNVPGTARWRWLADDEGGWMRCINGCCEVQ